MQKAVIRVGDFEYFDDVCNGTLLTGHDLIVSKTLIELSGEI